MRFLLLCGLLTACSTDTFTGDDGGGGTDGAPTDASTGEVGTGGGDAKADAIIAFDPSSLGSALVLWLEAADAKTGDAGPLVVSWSDRQHKYTTAINVAGSSTACAFPGLFVASGGNINHPVVNFCNANLGVVDAPNLRLGTMSFFIAAVIAPVQANNFGDVLFTKTPPGITATIPPNLTLLAPSTGGSLLGTLDGTSTASSQSTLKSEFQYVALVRNPQQIFVRVNAQADATASVSSSDDVSNANADVGIGGYRFDLGDIRNQFRGALAELLVVSDTARVGDVESYFKKKYNL